ncbi:MAG: hypothetical protein WCN92_00030 [Eubacteriales bacterium]
MLPKPSYKFEFAPFKNPNTFHRPVYMWCWNSPITAEKLTEQLRELAQAGGGGVMIVPEPKYFRPNTMKTTLSPDYLTKEYFEIYEAVAVEAEKLGLKIWFYDEGGWPSGSACGKVTKKNPNLACKRLSVNQKVVKKGELIEETALASFLYINELAVKVNNGDIAAQDGLLLSICVNMPTGSSEPQYPDLLNSEAVQAFIDIGCASYLPYIGKFAPNTIPMLFTDETRAANPPWSDGFAELFMKEKGYDIVEHLNELFENDEKGARTRIDYFDFWSKRFAKSFFAAMRKWCNENSFAFGGHLGGDDSLDCLKRHGYAHPLRMYREMDVPGVDTILRQIFPGGRRGSLIQDRSNTEFAPNYHFPRWASSVARQAGNPWVLSESFAVYGQGLTPAEMKWIINYQLVRGITLFCAATLASSVSGPYMANERPVHTSSSPMWQCLSSFHSYTARLSTLLSIGTPEVNTALYMPVRDVWSNTMQSLKVMADYDMLADTLERKMIDFDIIDDDCLELGDIEDGCLVVGKMSYSTIVLPKCLYMTSLAVQNLEAFKVAGGKVVFDVKKMHSIVKIEPEQALASLSVRKMANGKLYFIVNEDEKEISLNVILPEKTAPVLLDAETGKIYELEHYICEGGIKTTLRLPFAGSAAIMFKSQKIKTSAALIKKEKLKNAVVLDYGWKFKKHKAFVIGNQDFETVYYKNTAKPASLGPWAEYTGKDFSGEGIYSIDFDCPQEMAGKKVLLCLGKVEYACRARLNGKNLGLCAWPPFEYDLTGLLKSGNNRLEIIVFNTPANQYVHTKSFEKWDDATVGRYHPNALVFERESLGGGLYGKAVLYVE